MTTPGPEAHPSSVAGQPTQVRSLSSGERNGKTDVRSRRPIPPVSCFTVRCLRSFLTGSKGAAAVEFGILGLSFTMVLCFIVEIGMTMLMQSTLSEAARSASRLIRTGSIQRSGNQPAPFQAALCAKVKVLMDCGQLRYNVVSGDSFAALPVSIQTDANIQLVVSSFSPGTAQQDVIVQVGYTRNLYFPLLRDVIGTQGKLLLVSVVAFQNEPY